MSRIGKALLSPVIIVVAACGGGPPEEVLEVELDRLLDRTRDIAADAPNFDHDQTLRDIGVDSANGTVYRFDEHLDRASHHGAGVASENRAGGFSFLDIAGGTRQAENLVAYPVDLSTAEVAALELQIVSPFGGHLEVEVQGNRPGEAVTIDLRTVGDGDLHTYRLELGDTLTSWTSDRLVGVRVRNPKLHDVGPVEIRGAHFLPPTAAFADDAHGVVHRREGGETRRSIFQWSSSILRFAVEIGEPINAELDLGASVLLPANRVAAEVLLQTSQGGHRRLLSTTLHKDDGWTDWHLPLGELGTGRFFIELRISSDRPNVVFWSNPALVIPPERRFNVIMVLEDALRADHLSCYGYHRPTTPVKDAFADRGVRFANCFAQATKTRFSCPSFMTSLYPTATGVEGIWHRHPSLHDNYITLAEVLRRRGFVTASMHQNPNAGSPAGLHQGFSYLFENVPGRADELYTGDPVHWIEEYRDRNFFLYLHLADPHEPYDPPPGFRRWFDELEGGVGDSGEKPLDRSDPRWLQEARRALYDGEIRFNDHWFEIFLERLESLGLREDTLIIFMSDHGEHLGEHGRWSHNPPGYTQVLHTPLIMVFPRRLQPGFVVDEVVQNLDIMPTILDLAGVDRGSLLMQGDSLLPLMTGGAVDDWDRNLAYSEEALLKKSRHDPRPHGSVFFDRWHVLHSLYAPMELFDRAADPAETERIRSSRWLRARFRTFLSDMQRAELEIWQGVTGGETNVVVLDPETVSELKALGYLE